MADSKQKKKRQHYVPKFILRKFTSNERIISLYAFKTEIKILQASLKEQCYADYFYGMENSVEDGFAAMESEFSSIIGDLSSEKIDKISAEERHKIKQYIHFQRARTLGAARDINHVNDELMRNMFSKIIEKNKSHHPELADVKKEDLEEVHFETVNPQYISLVNAAQTAPILSDLSIKFLHNDSAIGFVLSDNPVVFYNQWAEHHPRFQRYPGITGLASKGLQIFMPLSPGICLTLFDPTTYAYGRHDSQICTLGKLDIERINTLQAINSFDCIYFDEKLTADVEINRLREQRKRFLERSFPRVRDISVHANVNSTAPPAEMIGVATSDLKIGAKFSFVRVIDTNQFKTYRTAMLPVRNPELAEFTEVFGQWLKKKYEDSEPATVAE